jgi:hypothetical protein
MMPFFNFLKIDMKTPSTDASKANLQNMKTPTAEESQTPKYNFKSYKRN